MKLYGAKKEKGTTKLAVPAKVGDSIITVVD